MDQIEYVRTNSKNRRVFPKSIPPERQNEARSYQHLIAIVFLLLASILYPSAGFFLKYFSLFLLVLFAIAFVKRLTHFAEEYKYLHCRYNDSLHLLINDVFTILPRQISIFFAASSVFLLAYSWETGHENLPMLLILAAVYLLKDILKLDDYPLRYSLRISDMMGLDYGSGIAHSFYHGYLKINLAPEDGLKDKMMIYEAEENVNFHQHKLYVLVPLSLYCPPTLESVSSRIEKAKTLDPITKNRAGVINRVYKNAVYKINYTSGNQQEKLYICAEYATPLKTLDEVTNKTGLHSEYYKKHKSELINQFYETLTSLIAEDPDMANTCEVIYYKDKKANGDLIDVGDLILKKLILDNRRMLQS